MRTFNYRNEAAFSAAFVKHLRRYNWIVQRIESGTTGRGIPDIYAVSPKGNAFWFELKREHGIWNGMAQIHWRPGQQAWLSGITKYKQRAFTIACFDNVIVVIRHHKTYKNDVVNGCDVAEFWYSWKDVVR